LELLGMETSGVIEYRLYFDGAEEVKE